MMIIRCAGQEGAHFCRSFFSQTRPRPRHLSAQLEGLTASLNALEHYPTLEAEPGGGSAAPLIAGE
ncbi:MAG: hypothetical protein AAF568_01825 [Pseudomonadota bacterium]